MEGLPIHTIASISDRNVRKAVMMLFEENRQLKERLNKLEQDRPFQEFGHQSLENSFKNVRRI